MGQGKESKQGLNLLRRKSGVRTSKIIALIFLITALSIGYVWQQARIVVLAYEKQKKAKLCRQLLDRNVFLRYNLVSLESSGSLSRNLKTFEADYEMPAFSQIVDLRSNTQKNSELARGGQQEFHLVKEKPRENLFLSLFSVRSQAEAQIK